jgi:acetyl esterase/lipase
VNADLTASLYNSADRTVRPSGRTARLGMLLMPVASALAVAAPSAVGRQAGGALGRQYFTLDDRVSDIVAHEAFAGFGHLLLPRQENGPDLGVRLSQVGSLMPYHGNVDPAVVVAALNDLVDRASAAGTVFHDFYSPDRKQQDPDKRFTGLFYFRASAGAPFAIICPGGGFSYVGSLHEGLPLASELSRAGFNAFVIRYRLGEQRATEDLATALTYVLEHAEKLGVARHGYSLWGGSAGARMVGNVVNSLPLRVGNRVLPQPAAAFIAYTAQGIYSRRFPPTFMMVSEDDAVAPAAVVDQRVHKLRAAGVEVEYRRYRSAGHGFGLGVGTDAQGWMADAIAFWQRQLQARPRKP